MSAQNLPLVSVIIPTYNRPDFLRRAVASAQKQRESAGFELEILVVDDASEAEISRRVERELSGMPGVRYLRNEENRGGGYSRNRGLKEARGRYINFLDDDDELLPGKIARQVAVFEPAMPSSEKEDAEKPLGIVTCHLLDERSGVQQRVPNAWRGDIYRQTLERYTIKLTSTMLFLARAVREAGGFDVRLPSSQEYDLMIRITQKYRVDYIDDYLTRACRSVNQISMNFDKKKPGCRAAVCQVRCSLQSTRLPVLPQNAAKTTRTFVSFLGRPAVRRSGLPQAAARRRLNEKPAGRIILYKLHHLF